MEFKRLESIIKSFLKEGGPLVGTENGLLYGNPDDISRAGVCWSPNYETIERAAEDKIELLIIHEPLFFEERHCTCFNLSELPYNQKKPNILRKRLLDKQGMSVYRVHSNLDISPEGNSFVLAKIYGARIDSEIEYGLVGNINRKSLKELIDFSKKALGSTNLRVVGAPEQIIERVAFVAGGGARFTEIVDQAVIKHAQLLISGDLVENTAIYAGENSISVIDPGHYLSERIGIKHFFEKLREKIPEIDLVFYESDPGVYTV